MERDRFDLPHPYVCLSTGYFSFSFTRAKLLLLGRRRGKKIEAKDRGLRVRKKDGKKRVDLFIDRKFDSFEQRRVNRKSFERWPRASRVNYSRGTRCSTTQASLERAKGSTFVIRTYIYICMYREGGEKEGGKRCSL